VRKSVNGLTSSSRASDRMAGARGRAVGVSRLAPCRAVGTSLSVAGHRRCRAPGHSFSALKDGRVCPTTHSQCARRRHGPRQRSLGASHWGCVRASSFAMFPTCQARLVAQVLCRGERVIRRVCGAVMHTVCSSCVTLCLENAQRMGVGTWITLSTLLFGKPLDHVLSYRTIADLRFAALRWCWYLLLSAT